MKCDNIDIEKFRDEYENKLMTLTEIAKSYGVSYSSIRRFALSNGIELRKKGDNGKPRKVSPSPFKQEISDERIKTLKKLFAENIPIAKIANELNVGRRAVERKISELNLMRSKSPNSREQYDKKNDKEIVEMYEGGMSSVEIAKVLNVTHKTVQNHLKHCGIKLRTISEAHFLSNKKGFPKELLSFEELYDMYVLKRMSKKAIAETLNVSPNVVNRCLKNFGIKIRGVSECKIGLMTGEKHPNWKGGVTSLYIMLREYFGRTQQKVAIKRDGYKCRMCGSKKNLQVHHIKPFKGILDTIISEHPELNVEDNKMAIYDIARNDERMNDLDNLITYCKDCHLYKVHKYKKRNIE